jgi:ribosome-interacting GTPase 1
MMDYDGAQIQLVDTPPLDRDYLEPGLIDLIRRADLILLVVDLQADPVAQLQKAVSVLEEHRISPAHLEHTSPTWQEATLLPFVVLANKCDDESLDELCLVFKDLLEEEWPALAVSSLTGRNLDQLKRTLFENLQLVRIYSKAPGKEPDRDAPFVLRKGATVEELAGRVHKDFTEKLKFAKVWGNSVFDGQMVQRDYVLQDGDVVELHI